MLTQAIKERILILDGGYGTALQGFGLQEADYRGDLLRDHSHPLKGNHDLLCLTRPQIVQEIHERFIEAGADIISTNTFSATSISQADFATEHLAYELNRAGAAIAREIADRHSSVERPRFVAGSVGPTNRTATRTSARRLQC